MRRMTVGILAAGIATGMAIGAAATYYIRTRILDAHQRELAVLQGRIDELQRELGKKGKAERSSS